MSWLEQHVTRLQAILAGLAVLVLLGLGTVYYVDRAVKREVGNNVEELKATVAEFRELLKEFKGVRLTQNNSQQVIVPDMDAELQDMRIRESYLHRIGVIE